MPHQGGVEEQEKELKYFCTVREDGNTPSKAQQGGKYGRGLKKMRQ